MRYGSGTAGRRAKLGKIQGGGGGCRLDKGGGWVTKNVVFLRDKNINFLEVPR